MLVNLTREIASSSNSDNRTDWTNFRIQFLVTYSSQRNWTRLFNRSLSLYIADPSIDPHSRSGKHKNSRRDKKAFFFLSSFFFFSSPSTRDSNLYWDERVFHQGEGIYGNEASLSRTHGLIIQFFDRNLFLSFSRSPLLSFPCACII